MELRHPWSLKAASAKASHASGVCQAAPIVAGTTEVQFLQIAIRSGEKTARDFNDLGQKSFHRVQYIFRATCEKVDLPVLSAKHFENSLKKQAKKSAHGGWGAVRARDKRKRNRPLNEASLSMPSFKRHSGTKPHDLRFRAQLGSITGAERTWGPMLALLRARPPMHRHQRPGRSRDYESSALSTG
jgi:hypothetical protein